MNRIFYDTETSGLPNYQRPSDAPYQPHIVQMTALLTDYYGTKISSIDLLIQTDGWTSDADALKAHGITKETCDASGVPEFEAVQMFMRLVERADLRVAHNDAFDARIIRIALKRMGLKDTMASWKEMAKFDTMHKSTKLVKCPPTPKMLAVGRKNYKPPTLEEAYEHFAGEKMKGAHNAMYDVLACRRVYFAILDAEGEGIERQPESPPAQEPDPARQAVDPEKVCPTPGPAPETDKEDALSPDAPSLI